VLPVAAHVVVDMRRFDVGLQDPHDLGLHLLQGFRDDQVLS
jgi:hypothetical protein